MSTQEANGFNLIPYNVHLRSLLLLTLLLSVEHTEFLPFIYSLVYLVKKVLLIWG